MVLPLGFLEVALEDPFCVSSSGMNCHSPPGQQSIKQRKKKIDCETNSADDDDGEGGAEIRGRYGETLDSKDFSFWSTESNRTV